MPLSCLCSPGEWNAERGDGRGVEGFPTAAEDDQLGEAKEAKQGSAFTRGDVNSHAER